MRMIYAMMLAALMALTGISAPAWAQTAQPEIEIVGLQAHPSDVDIGNASAWPRINVDPFRGSVDQASLVLNPKTNIRPFEYHEAFAMRTRGECYRYLFGPTDQFRTTFGRDRSMLANPGFTGWSDVCIVRADGSAVIFPDGCTNIGPGMAVIRRNEKPKDKPPVATIPPPTFTATVTQAQEADVQALPYFGWAPAPRYSGGNRNIRVGQKLDSTSTSTSGDGSCNSCAPHADH